MFARRNIEYQEGQMVSTSKMLAEEDLRRQYQCFVSGEIWIKNQGWTLVWNCPNKLSQLELKEMGLVPLTEKEKKVFEEKQELLRENT